MQKEKVELNSIDGKKFEIPLSLALHSPTICCVIDPSHNLEESKKKSIEVPFKIHLIQRVFSILEKSLSDSVTQDEILDEEALDLLDISVWLGI